MSSDRDRRSIKLKNTSRIELLDTTTRVTKAQHVARDNVNFLWKIGLSRSVININNNRKYDFKDPIIEEAVGRLVMDSSAASTSNQSIALFCSCCKNIFIPGVNCTIRTLSKLRKKHEVQKRKKKTKKNKGEKCINKGLVYTCKICGNRKSIGVFAQKKRE